jgi:glutamine amidotransferase
MQLFANYSEEGDVKGLGWIDANVIKFSFNELKNKIPVPHMGWNSLVPLRQHNLFHDQRADARFYFAHSYHFSCSDPLDCLATTQYGFEFSSVIQKGNIMGVQFHPEKSHKFGMQLLKNFAELV